MTPDKCVTGKKKSNYAQAKKEARYMKRHLKYPDSSPVPYKCKTCNCWHVGNI